MVFVLTVVNLLFRIYYFMMFAYILMSWVPNLQGSPIGQLLSRFVEPIFVPFRKIIPPIGMIDLSPIVAFFALYFAQIGANQLIIMLFGGR